MSPLMTWAVGLAIGGPVALGLVVVIAYLIPQDRRRSSR